ncbi:MAG TPA: ATPase [Clostridiales bacterium]|nr:ATPase [Clostridia bacterium]MDD4679543.1 ATPase [Clostridia bacterium]HCS72522.1 ATPase [Clostridiales bacterium]
MNIISLIDILEDELEKGVSIPFITKALVDRERCLEIIKDIRLSLPEEIKQAEWLKKEQQRILVEAQKEAEVLTAEAEQRIRALVDENEITQNAYQQSREIVETAQNNAKEIRLGAKEYADAFLEDVELYLAGQLETLHSNRQELNAKKR